MGRIAAIIIIILGLGCRRVAPELEPYVRSFENTFDVSVANPVGFAKLDDAKVGVCYWGKPGNPVVIDLDFYKRNKDNPMAMEQLVFHELGHCVFLLPHNPKTDTAGHPISIMYPYTFGSGTWYRSNTSYYYEELHWEHLYVPAYGRAK